MKNRGMLLESIINKTIKRLNNNGNCVMHKINIPIKFASISNHGKKLEAQNAFISSKSTTDYYGIYSGIFLAFEAKSTKGNSIPGANIKNHQQEYLSKINRLGGLGFYIIMFSDYDEIFLLKGDHINTEIKKTYQRKYIAKHGVKLEIIYPGTINLLEGWDEMI